MARKYDKLEMILKAQKTILAENAKQAQVIADCEKCRPMSREAAKESLGATATGLVYIVACRKTGRSERAHLDRLACRNVPIMVAISSGELARAQELAYAPLPKWKRRRRK